MEKILKIFMTITMILIFTFTLTGCGKEEISNNIIESIGENNNQEDENKQNNSNNEEEIEIYSDDTKLVFDYSGVYKIVYYFSGDEITGLEYYFEYEDSTEASYAVAGIKANYYGTSVSSVSQKGKYVVVKFNEEKYKDQTVQEVKDTYSFLEQVYEQVNEDD